MATASDSDAVVPVSGNEEALAEPNGAENSAPNSGVSSDSPDAPQDEKSPAPPPILETDEEAEPSEDIAILSVDEELSANDAADPTQISVSRSGRDEEGNGTADDPYATLNKAFEEAAATATVYVMDDLTLESEVTAAGSIAKGISARNITLRKAPGVSGSVDIARYKNILDSDENYIGYMFTVSAGSTLTIEGITINGNSVAGSNAAVAVYGSFTMKDSTIENNKVSGMGGGVYVMGAAARFDMQDGVITGNTATLGGSGVYLHSGAMNISGDVRIGDSDDDNGVYLTSNVRINIAGTLGSSARVNVEKHQNARVGTQIATKAGGGLTAADVGKFFWQTIAYKIVAGSGESADSCVLAVNETDFYIAGKGNDNTGKGSVDKPFATLTRAFEELPRGAGVKCTVHVKSDVSEQAIATLSEGDVTVKTWENATKKPASIVRGDFNEYIIQVRGGAKLTLDNLIIDGGEVTNCLSALGIEGGSEVVMQDVEITRNYTQVYGGGVTLVGGSKLTVGDGSVILGNSAPERKGGAIYVFDDGKSQPPELT
ncbi:MAG: hypothetical protein LBL63_01515, partial [Clostridiales Family XIII bacterium]|nr:hypothetical protein [Clostridiales Family XIII bacterium]